MAIPAASRPAPPYRLSARGSAIVVAVVALVVIFATDQILPPTTDRQAELRFWLAARATGVVALLFMTGQIVVGLVLSHPHNKATWRLSKLIFPWHDHLWVFVLAFLVVHVASLLADQKSGVDLIGALVPGMSQYRSSPVALGTLGLYAFLITALTARYMRILPAGAWLIIHRAAIGIFVLGWLHGILAGTDSTALEALYIGMGLAVMLATAYRYWASKHARPTFSTRTMEVDA